MWGESGVHVGSICDRSGDDLGTICGRTPRDPNTSLGRSSARTDKKSLAHRNAKEHTGGGAHRPLGVCALRDGVVLARGIENPDRACQHLGGMAKAMPLAARLDSPRLRRPEFSIRGQTWPRSAELRARNRSNPSESRTANRLRSKP